MITEESVERIGVITKTHGVRGELLLQFENDMFELANPDYIICRMDGILVPFFIREYRFRGNDGVLFFIEDVNSEDMATRFVKAEVYLEKKQTGHIVPDEISHYTWSSFIGFKLLNQNDELIGDILDVDESTMNTLFLLNYGDEEVMIPAQEELIEWIDEAAKEIKIYIPEGLLGLE